MGLSTGTWARETSAAIGADLEAGGEVRASEGEVVDTKTVGRFGGVVEILVTTRERLKTPAPGPAPYQYALYLARLEPAKGAYAVSDWEPQL